MYEKYAPTTNPSSRLISTQTSPRFLNQANNSQVSLTANEVSRMVNSQFKEGQTVKGKSRIQYVPYQKKVIEYQERQYVQKVPIKRKVIEYEERKVVQEVPREVITTDYYAVENIKQYYKEIVPQKKIQMVPVQRKVKRVEYVPVQKQIVHYPQGQNKQQAKGKSRLLLQKQGVNIRNDAQYRQIDPRLIYQYATNNVNANNPVGYVQDGNYRFLSNSPSKKYSVTPRQTEYKNQNVPNQYHQQYRQNQRRPSQGLYSYQ